MAFLILCDCVWFCMSYWKKKLYICKGIKKGETIFLKKILSGKLFDSGNYMKCRNKYPISCSSFKHQRCSLEFMSFLLNHYYSKVAQGKIKVHCRYLSLWGRHCHYRLTGTDFSLKRERSVLQSTNLPTTGMKMSCWCSIYSFLAL